MGAGDPTGSLEQAAHAVGPEHYPAPIQVGGRQASYAAVAADKANLGTAQQQLSRLLNRKDQTSCLFALLTAR